MKKTLKINLMEVVSVWLKYSSRFLNLISIVLSILIVGLVSLGMKFIQNHISANVSMDTSHVVQENINVDTKEEVENPKEEKIEDLELEEKIDTEEENKEGTKEFDWYIEIPKIKLYAPIEEGTDDEVLNRSVGHFENTARRNGNCGLAAHNRGYRVNYFARVKELEKDDTIFYFVDGKKYEYRITEIAIIYETDWSNLEETEDSRITLITCVENREEYRLCVQGILVEE